MQLEIIKADIVGVVKSILEDQYGYTHKEAKEVVAKSGLANMIESAPEKYQSMGYYEITDEVLAIFDAVQEQETKETEAEPMN